MKIKVLIAIALVVALLIGIIVKQEYDRIQCVSHGGTYVLISDKVSAFTGLPQGGMCARKGTIL